jgi:hypothetical protein
MRRPEVANPDQSIPPGQMSNADQGMDIGMSPHEPDADEKDRVLDADEIQTLEHGGYGGEGELEYNDRQPRARRAAGKYLNQTDMTDETGNHSLSEQAENSE